MDCTATSIPYSCTGYFSSLLIDYISGNEKLQPFYTHSTTIKGIQQAIEQRQFSPAGRQALITLLQQQYAGITLSPKQQQNLQWLQEDNTFTICTAHQPNIFTGPLYFIYKIIHAIKLADVLNGKLTAQKFVPVYYMGSEDADLDELGYIFTDGYRRQWQTKQTGAVGRMKADAALQEIITGMHGQLSVLPFGNEILQLTAQCYASGSTIEQATFKFVHALFQQFGLIILLPDRAGVKKQFAPVIEKELLTGFSQKAVQHTMANFPAEYKIQAAGREINLFYLTDTARERIVLNDGRYSINNTSISFSKDEILQELQQHPERFSPNVILRPVLQETILPNIAFIGGGGEIAYWLELKAVFTAANTPCPVLIARNSFLLLEKKYNQQAEKLGLTDSDLFKTSTDILTTLVKRNGHFAEGLIPEKKQLSTIYEALKKTAAATDTTLIRHINAIEQKALDKIDTLEQKLLKAVKRKFETEQQQVQKIKEVLFPNGSLQERTENFMPFYARYGAAFIQMIYSHSLTLEQEFCIIRINA
ncbi:MAG TPA: bacillithiol biosynthesis cysteine-adding enzyme BshC [Ferruginibacter sp.]|nr:bacillithiol biosynthesis cysteine-adding enzyme BshC [Ferruginibacter sp.]HMP20428.1 bacillithiol biosynthesis cysteine-adding enzyme BshC [Ferruginibacter sp.]